MAPKLWKAWNMRLESHKFTFLTTDLKWVLTCEFRPATKSAYNSKFRLFIAFCAFIEIQLHQLSSLFFLSYLEFLTENNASTLQLPNMYQPLRPALQFITSLCPSSKIQESSTSQSHLPSQALQSYIEKNCGYRYSNQLLVTY